MTTCEICKSPTLGVTMCDDCYSLRSIDFSFAAQWADTRKTYAVRRRAWFGDHPGRTMTAETFVVYAELERARLHSIPASGFVWQPDPDDSHPPLHLDDIPNQPPGNASDRIRLR